eukprot:gene12274-14494_t
MLRRYLAKLESGVYTKRPAVRTLHHTPTTALWDADRGLGMLAMHTAVAKAKAHGVGVVVGWMQTAPAAECVGGTVVYPGLLEHRRMMERKRHGIPLHKDIVGWLWEQGKALGVRECLTEIKT